MCIVTLCRRAQASGRAHGAGQRLSRYQRFGAYSRRPVKPPLYWRALLSLPSSSASLFKWHCHWHTRGALVISPLHGTRSAHPVYPEGLQLVTPHAVAIHAFLFSCFNPRFRAADVIIVTWRGSGSALQLWPWFHCTNHTTSLLLCGDSRKQSMS